MRKIFSVILLLFYGIVACVPLPGPGTNDIRANALVIPPCEFEAGLPVIITLEGNIPENAKVKWFASAGHLDHASALAVEYTPPNENTSISLSVEVELRYSSDKRTVHCEIIQTPFLTILETESAPYIQPDQTHSVKTVTPETPTPKPQPRYQINIGSWPTNTVISPQSESRPEPGDDKPTSPPIQPPPKEPIKTPTDYPPEPDPTTCHNNGYRCTTPGR